MNILKHDTYLIINNFKLNNFNKTICMFDLDGTIIEFNLHSSDYVLLYKNTINKLKEINKDSHILIISNQKQLNKSNMYEYFISKITKLFNEFTQNNIFVEMYVSIKNDKYRKPNIGFIDLIKKKYSNKIEYYCGDALGRKNDFSDTDLKFALNLDTNIFSPEEIFLLKNKENKLIKYPKYNSHIFNFDYIPKEKEMIILVGYPASGKSSIANRIQEKGFISYIYYEIINRDTLKDMKKCITKTEISLQNKMNVIIDNTNPDISSRSKFIKIAHKYEYNVTIINMVTSREISIHNNYYRHIKYNCPLIPDIVYNIFKSKYQKPTLKEADFLLNAGINIYDYDYDKYFF